MTVLVRFTLGFMLVFMAFFLIALVLIQRGRGGGLAGAFGGAGGQSAFGTKAGDLFTRITVVTAAIWIILCILATNVLGTKQSRLSPDLGGAAGQLAPAATDGEMPEMEPAESETGSDADADAGPDADVGAGDTDAAGEGDAGGAGDAATSESTAPAAD